MSNTLEWEKLKISKVSKSGTYLFEWSLDVFPGMAIEFIKTEDGKLAYRETSIAKERELAKAEEREKWEKSLKTIFPTSGTYFAVKDGDKLYATKEPYNYKNEAISKQTTKGEGKE